MSDVAKLVPTKPDKEIADEIKADMIELLKPVLDRLTKAHNDGFQISFNLGPNAINQIVIQSLTISKQF